MCLKGHYGGQALKMENNKLKGRKRIQNWSAIPKRMMSLKEQKWIPEIIISHSGFGCGLYARQFSNRQKLLVTWNGGSILATKCLVMTNPMKI